MAVAPPYGYGRIMRPVRDPRSRDVGGPKVVRAALSLVKMEEE